jgi:hypothetical protein
VHRALAQFDGEALKIHVKNKIKKKSKKKEEKTGR